MNRMRCMLLSAFGTLLLLSCDGASLPSAPSPSPGGETALKAAGAWMKEAAIPLTTVEAGNGFTDLAPLAPRLADVRIVGLGEATHGTREFFQLKHRMFEFLVSELGFTVFAIEANFTEALAVDHYVLTGEGDPARALAGLYFWTWNTEEVLSLIQWMRAYNADPAHSRKLRFYGVDSQISVGPAQVMLDYLAQVDPAYRAEVEPWLTRLLQFSELAGTPEQEVEVAHRAAGYITPVQELRTRLEEQRAAYVAARGEDAYLWAARHARMLEQAVLVASLTGARRTNQRDVFMAENASWVLDHEGPEAKMALWAHNGHVMRENGPYIPMGAHLRDAFGDAYYVFRLAFNQGEFRALLYPLGGPVGPLQTHRIDPVPSEAFEAALTRTGLPLLALDLRAAPTSGLVAQYLDQPVPMREIGAAYTPGYSYLLDVWPRRAFDGALFVKTTTASLPNPPLSP
jgi:erythromycin esterase